MFVINVARICLSLSHKQKREISAILISILIFFALIRLRTVERHPIFMIKVCSEAGQILVRLAFTRIQMSKKILQKLYKSRDILRSYSCSYDAYCLLRCGIVQYYTYLPTFQMYVLPPSSWYKSLFYLSTYFTTIKMEVMCSSETSVTVI
jgi:hypothetical protein